MAAIPDPQERGALGWFVAAVLLVIANAGAVARYAEATAAQLLDRSSYVTAVLGARPVPPAWTPRAGMKKP
jgi:hypothetical protein